MTAFSSKASTGRAGFTLLEAMMAVMVIGVGTTATLQLLAAGTVSNCAATELTTAINLSNNIHEILAGVPLYDPAYPGTWNPGLSSVSAYNGVTEFDGQTFSPPLDVQRNPIAAYSNWAQVISVVSISNGQLTSALTDSTSQPAAKVTVQIQHAGRTVYQTSWVRTAN